MTNQESIARVQKAIEEIKAGRMVILVDDEDRENEGDITMAAELVTPEAITFMATKACGLICVTLTRERVEELDLPMMVSRNQAPLGTAFTVSIEAREGVSTGISAADRSHTIKVACDAKSGKEDIVSPGHVFPLRAMPGGVLQRAGQTEGSVDLARLAGLTPAGVICEIMRPDGTMARMPDLELFAKEHGLHIVTIEDMVQYRLQMDSLVEKAGQKEVELSAGDKTATFTAHIYRAAPGIRRREYVALVLGDVADGQPVPVRGHVAKLADDLFGARTEKNSPSVREVLEKIIDRKRGILLYLPSRDSIEDELLGTPEEPTRAPGENIEHGEIREYGIGAQILLDLGVRRLQMISNNPHKLVGLDAWGFETTEQIRLEEI